MQPMVDKDHSAGNATYVSCAGDSFQTDWDISALRRLSLSREQHDGRSMGAGVG